MRTFEYTSITEHRTITSASDESAPTDQADSQEGVAATPHSTHTVFSLTGGLTSADVTPYWYDDKAGAWTAGTAETVTGAVPYEVKHRGRRVEIKLTNITKSADIQVNWYQHGVA